MNAGRRMKTDNRLWLVFSVLAFVLIGFLSPWTERIEVKNGPGSLWGMLFTGPRGWKVLEFAPIIIVYAGILVLPAMAFGWVAQAIVVVLKARPARARSN